MGVKKLFSWATCSTFDRDEDLSLICGNDCLAQLCLQLWCEARWAALPAWAENEPTVFSPVTTADEFRQMHAQHML